MEGAGVLTIRSDLGEIARVSSLLEDLMAGQGFMADEILDTQLAVEEAITNIIVHGYRGGTGEIVIRCRATEEQVEVRVEDTAPAFDPLTLPEPDLTAAVEDRKIGGLGVFLIRQVMDGIAYRRENKKNILVLVKRRSSPTKLSS
jgi:anti-sigma regulatory factor (Ser/Thr protein kinase)